MTESIRNPTIILPKESEELIKESFEKRNKIKKIVNVKKRKINKKLDWLNEL